ncbi:MAG TPA: OmpA family protein [Azospirillum sp.]|nr:OmpA family protein [Azospirillum sp.]
MAVALLLPTAAMAATEGFYVGGAGGVNWTSKAKYKDETLASLGQPSSVKLEYDRGWVGSLSAGYATAFGLRGELEGSRRWGNKVDGDNDPTAEWSGFTDSWGIMGNLLYDINTGTAFTPYIGIGAGMAQVDSKVAVSTLVGRNFVDDKAWRFAYQGIAGVAYNLNRNLAITADYRYFATTNPKFDGPLGDVKGEYSNHSVMVGLRYTFGAPIVPAAVAAPVAPAAPAPQPQTEYLVFFDWNKADITPASDRIIGDAAAAAGSMRAVGIHVIGHTDTSGSPSYNQRLSERRAEAVRRALVARGVPAANITTEGKGETSLLVPTGDNVREPSNRRAQIMIRVSGA